MKIIKIKGNSQTLNLQVADNFYTRFKGLMGAKTVPQDGLLIKPCSSVHMFFMKIALDIVYLNKSNKVIYVQTLNPWQIGKIVKGSKAVIEMKANTCPFEIGEQIQIID